MPRPCWAVLCLAATAQTAVAENGWRHFDAEPYVRIFSGADYTDDAGNLELVDGLGTSLSFTDADLGTGMSYGFGLGIRLFDAIRLEASGRRAESLDVEAQLVQPVLPTDLPIQGEVLAHTVLGNVFIEPVTFRLGDYAARPFIGAGAGVSRNRLRNLSASNVLFTLDFQNNSETDFAWNALGGMSLQFTERFTGELAYSYTDLGEVRSGLEVVNSLAGTSNAQQAPSVSIRSHGVSIGLRLGW